MINTRDLFRVYFIRPIEALGPIKIGLSSDPAARMRTSAAWSPFPLEVVGSVPGRWLDEQFLHSCLAEHHFHGEWFYAEPLVLDAMHWVLSTGGFELARSKLTPLANVRSKKIRDTKARRLAA